MQEANSEPTPPARNADPPIVHLSGGKFVLGCALAAALVLGLGSVAALPAWLLAVEVFATVIALFVLGSIRYRLDKNALTYGAALVILATFVVVWWKLPASGEFRAHAGAHGVFQALWQAIEHHRLLSIPGLFHGLDELVHLDTMLFILGLTFFVAVIAQTRVLETITFGLLRKSRGRVLPTVLAVTAIVSFASGILDGVSMIGLTIRTLVIIMALAAAPLATVRYAVMVCTVVTTVCGMWLAYGEPPNLIMKANVKSPTGQTLLDDAFFLRYCLPLAVASFACVALSLRLKIHGQRVRLDKLDIVDANVATVRFLQAERHGEVLSPVEFVETHRDELGPSFEPVLRRVEQGEALGLALVHEQAPPDLRRRLLGRFTSEDLAATLDRHYVLEASHQSPGTDEGEAAVQKVIAALRGRRLLAAGVGAAALGPFIGCLILHAIHHEVPLFLASFAGFAVAFVGIASLPRVRALALREARHEFAEYLFLIPLFLSISLLSAIGFFEQLKHLLEAGIAALHPSALALGQFYFCTVLSAMLDNNVVADFTGKAIAHLGDLGLIHLFATAQIAGYALGGCLTHIGSAQSVVAFAFIHRTLDARYTPAQWIREMLPLGLLIGAALTVLITLESVLLGLLH